ncbi:response regulator transcription factor [Burkholderia cepacia]|uniref:response regulator transcription factor n=1 Tax=Burkholderia cepacia TaxID=292 RepID=UPI0015763792|nr:response regulator transcription factor [Burkholderia cepacia]NTX21297.1 response regulator transcription factor [Burkholderia cepacia]
MNILLVQDDVAQAEAVENALQRSGHRISRAETAANAMRFLKTDQIDLVVLDWKLPGMSGFDVLRWIRGNLGREPAVVFLTNRVLEVDVVRALEAGADDYIVKPFRAIELVARIGALLRRTSRNEKVDSTIVVGPYVFDVARRNAFLHGKEIELTTKEFDVAAFLFANVGRAVSRDMLAKLVWGRELDSTSRTVDTHIYRLRRKLSLGSEDGVRLSTVYTHGYRLDKVIGHRAESELNHTGNHGGRLV